MLVLGIESSCDETGVAMVQSQGDAVPTLLAHALHSQIEMHQAFGGVVPELASRDHIRRVLPLTRQVLADSGRSLQEVDVVAYTRGPGLAGALLVGSGVACALGAALGKPVLGVHHLEGHLLSPFMDKTEVPRHVGLIISGGHTLLMEVKGAGDYIKLGGTRDDAAGEAFDKVGKMLGLAYPGGPEIEKAAVDGDASAYDFPRSMMQGDELDFSFSGLKTAVLYTLQKHPNARVADIAASFQSAVVEVLVEKAMRAAKLARVRSIGLSGGVSLNSALRQAFIERCKKEGFALAVAEPSVCTDNAAMIAFAGILKFFAGKTDRLDGDIDPNLRL